MAQLDMISDTIAKLEATVDNAATPLTGATLPRAPHKARGGKRLLEVPERRKLPKLKASKTPRTKKAVLIGLLSRKSGATVQVMMDATGWQAHSVRAGLTGLRKDGHQLERRSNRKGEAVYAIVEASQD